MHTTQVMNRVHLNVHSAFLYLGNDWTDYSEIWRAVRNSSAMRFIHVVDGVNLHAHTYDFLFRIPGTATPGASPPEVPGEPTRFSPGSLNTLFGTRLCRTETFAGPDLALAPSYALLAVAVPRA